MPALEIKNIRKSFGKKTILSDITFSADETEIVGLIGKSGCGKSTLLKTLVGLYKPDSGKVLVDGDDISKDIMALRRKIGFTTQDNSFYEKLTILENMRYYANLYRVPKAVREDRILSLLRDVGLFEHREKLAERISGGMKRRLEFAISLVHDPKILILDEPTTGLDPLLIEQFWKVVMDVVTAKRKIVLVTSHILPEIESHSTKVLVMHDGKIIRTLDKRSIKGLEKRFSSLVGGGR